MILNDFIGISLLRTAADNLYTCNHDADRFTNFFEIIRMSIYELLESVCNLWMFADYIFLFFVNINGDFSI